MTAVRLLGPIDVVDDSGTVFAPASPLRRTLLALLALHAGELLTVDWLLEHAWSGDPPESGPRALRFHVSQLRREIGAADLIQTRPGGYRLAVSEAHVDALAVEERARAARRERDRSVAATMYSDLLAMWRGEPFVDAAPCAALDDEALRLNQLRLTINEERLEARLDAGQSRELVAELTHATAQHPLHESLWSMLIVAQYRAGLQADALRSYEQMRVVLADLGLEPSSELRVLQQRVLQHDETLLVGSASGSERELAGTPARTRGRTRHVLPIPTTPLIDSDQRLDVVTKLLEAHRLVTLTGPGGVGKTRLAIELGWSCGKRFGDGVWLVELAPVGNPELVLGAVASTLSIRAQEGMSHVESIVDWFSDREVLLILDNCEHLIDSVRPFVAVLVARCPSVRILLTSREPLGVGGERVHRVEVLDPESDGFTLFVERATAADSSFVLSEDDRQSVTQICRRLDGLPLAIELAAARVRSLAPVELRERLDDRFKLLRGRARDGLDHHEALSATVEWSYRLLNEPERTLFDRLSVFAGSFDLRAVEAVCMFDSNDNGDVVDLLGKLVDKSMVIAERSFEGTRYRMLETLRQFAIERLSETDMSGGVAARHLAHYVVVAEGADNVFRGSEQAVGARTFDREWSNLRAAHAWAIVTRDLDMADRLVRATWLHAQSQMRFEHGDWAARTVALESEGQSPHPDTYAEAAFWTFHRDTEDARSDQLVERGLQLAGSPDDPSAALCLVLSSWDDDLGKRRREHLERIAARLDLDREWWVLVALADHPQRPPPAHGIDHVARLVETAERVRAPLLMVEADLASCRRLLTSQPLDLEGALHLATRALETARRAGGLLSEGESLRAVAISATALGRGDALNACHEALAHLYAIRYWFRVWHAMESVSLALASNAQIQAASTIVGHLEAHHPPYGVESLLDFRSRTLETIRSDAHAETEVAIWMAEGAAADRNQIVHLALAALKPAVDRASPDRTASRNL
jgi:predicted ATPase/DNA-binding SARP family transcriptional activator